MDKVIVWIPHHLPYLTFYQEISLRQCQKVLGTHPIHLACPEGMDISAIKKHLKNIQIDYFHKKWFSSYENYNFLKKSNYFYERYAQYEYILTYELDAFVFRDELYKWCEQGYDYIGAPWFKKNECEKLEEKFSGVGNSGFSLRRVSACLDVLAHLKRRRFSSIKHFSGFVLRNIMFHNKALVLGNLNEDIFWCQYVTKVTKFFTVGSFKDSMLFSFEENPAILYKKTNKQLPFGCHAWEKNNIKFWKPHIEVFGYQL